jgi:hypothetical protein
MWCHPDNKRYRKKNSNPFGRENSSRLLKTETLSRNTTGSTLDFESNGSRTKKRRTSNIGGDRKAA